MTTYLIDSNILVYAINEDSEYHLKSRNLIEQANQGKIKVCVSLQNLLETFAIITDKKRIDNPISYEEAIGIIETDYIYNPRIEKILPKLSVIPIVSELIRKYKINKQEVFEVFLVATMIDNEVKGIYTKNTKDFEKFEFLEVKNIDTNL